MSGPTRGMVAGQPIQTTPQSKEWDEGFARTFGERKVARGRYRWDTERQEMVEIGADWTDKERRAQTATEELTYGNAVATDGTPVNTRKRHREYMKANGLTLADDFKDTWAKAESERAAYYTGQQRDPQLREALGRALYKRGRK